MYYKGYLSILILPNHFLINIFDGNRIQEFNF